MNQEVDPSEAYQATYQVLMHSAHAPELKMVDKDTPQPQDFRPASQSNEGKNPIIESKTDSRKTVMSNSIRPIVKKETSSLPSLGIRLPTLGSKPRKLIPKRQTKEGKAAEGISILAVAGWVGSLDSQEVYLRHDSGADVSLISKELYASLKKPPPIRKGVKLKLWQLTDKDAEIQGYVRIPIFTQTKTGMIIQTEVEAYLVPNMSVPILLELVVEAVKVEKIDEFKCLRASVYSLQSFVKARNHRRSKNKQARKRRKQEKDEFVIWAKEDMKIKAHSSRNIEVKGPFKKEENWIVEKNIIPLTPTSYLTVPNVLIRSSQAFVPMANPLSVPKVIRKGDILGTMHKAESFFNRQPMEEGCEKTANFICQLAGESDNKSERDSRDTAIDEAKDYSPKTAAMLEASKSSSKDIKTLLDIGNLPKDLEEQVWAMLKKHKGAFSFNGQLGDYPAEVRINTKEGALPVSLPMYMSSPAKCEVIDKQIDAWFEKGIIEASKSLRGAPIVIAYRNGKPRFCVDYRKLNALTIPDEFPIPRQMDILAALLGSQVLSSLDALSGFTQLKLHPDDLEKTAFRSHRGLYQFRHMPFGLRNGPSVFQRVMQEILSPYLWIFMLVYIDDIVVYSKTFKEHITHLDKVLNVVEESGITLSPTKCHFFNSSILLLGHKVSRLGLSTHQEKVRAIMELTHPTKVSELQTFLGMLVYFQSFIPYFTDWMTPLFDLLKKGKAWEWTKLEEYA
ncbi:uncharacterized protein ARMOST_20091 [Armillaria ostoyae]|uniref:Reverse transcriptase domain-containing protein n=1 Tax=Armillaria ostoyae TaxID=47428 RepID=A0A284S6D7_ARMOS|nr:uncharacterized protein ARMOST_20091 [Armillaria ostoyae]